PIDEVGDYRLAGDLQASYLNPHGFIVAYWRVYWLDDQGAVLDMFHARDTAYNKWVNVSATGQAPAGTVAARIAVYASNLTPNGTSYWFRRPILTRGADPVDFFTGDSDDTGRWTYEWSGTPNESTSLKFDNDQTPTLHSDVDDA